MLGLTCIFVAFSFASAVKYNHYTEVDGECVDFEPIPDFDQERFIAKKWYILEANWIGEGDTCMTVNLTDVGNNMVTVDSHIYNTKEGKYFEDIKHLLHSTDGRYRGVDHAAGSIFATDYDNYQAYVQCRKEDNGKTGVMLMFSTRSGEIDDDARAKFEDITEHLVELKLYPGMKPIPHDNCPEK